VLLVSLIGHYERTAQHLAGATGLASYAAVEGPTLLRVQARDVWSLVRGAAALLWHVWSRRAPMIGVPRSNSRALRLLLSLAPRTPVFSYSDGLGDAVHRFHLEGRPRYVGHVGFALLSPPPLIHTIALRECVEPWGDWIRYDPTAPCLVIVKRPKEVTLPIDYLVQVHSRLIGALRRRGEIVLSGAIDGLEVIDGARQIGPLSRLAAPLAISGAVGLPSTAFATLATRLPSHRLHVVKLGCRQRWPEAARRNRLMIEALERCLPALAPGASPRALDPAS
jgi:hypothetical protein